MSLIEEALRRIKEPLPGQPRPQPPPQSTESAPVHSWPIAQPPVPPQPAVARTPQSSLAILAMTVLGLAAILLIGGMVWMLGRDTVRPPVSAQPPSPAAPSDASPADEPAAQPPSLARVVPQGASSTGPVLSGVIEGLGEPYAVINGMIVGVGDRLADAVVLAIDNGAVTMRLGDGSDVTLRVPR